MEISEEYQNSIMFHVRVIHGNNERVVHLCHPDMFVREVIDKSKLLEIGNTNTYLNDSKREVRPDRTLRECQIKWNDSITII